MKSHVWRAALAAMAACFSFSLAAEAAAQVRAQTPRRMNAAEISAVQRQRGAAEAPAVVQAANVPCDITEALWVGSAGQGATAQNAYEVACRTGLGYVLVTRPQQPTLVIDCLYARTVADREQAAGNAASQTRCTLPANADPWTRLQPVLQQLNRRCTANNGRAVGELPQAIRYELACTEGGALLLDVPKPGQTGVQPSSISCLEASSAGIECQFAPREQLVAQVRPLLTGAAAQCQPSDVRWLGRSADANRNEFIEVACGASGGFVIEVTAAGQTQTAYSCDAAQARGLGCRLTQTSVAQTQELQLYAQSARQLGIDCTPSGYRRIGLESGTQREAVELQCGGRPESVVAFFPIPGRSTVQTASAIDCLYAEARGIGCRLTPIAAAFPRISQQLSAGGRECPVSAVQARGRLGQEDLVEVACDPTRRGYILALPTGAPNGLGRVLRCVDARNIGVECQLPANRAGDRPRS